MGALFNTTRTRRIVQMLNDAYGPDGLQDVRNNDAQQIAELGLSATSSYDFCFQRGLAFATSDRNGNARWKKWLDVFDANGGQQARAAMADAIADNNCTAIEFFAVPDRSFRVVALPLQGHGPHYTLTITAYTPTIDELR